MSGDAFRFDPRALARSFDRVGIQPAAAGAGPARIAGELLERLQFFKLEPRVIVDLGCGAGAASVQLRRRYPLAQVLAVDSAFAMARAARRSQRFWRRFDCLCADARALPLAAHSVDLVYSNLMLQWCDAPATLFAQVQQVLRPGGLMLFSTLGPETLRELRAAWASADQASHVSAFADMPRLAAAMSHAGLSEPVMDREILHTHYPDVRALMNELRGYGARHAADDRRRTLTGRTRLHQMIKAYESQRTDAGIPASWEVIYGAGFAGSAPAAAGEFAVPLGAIRARGHSR
jgi:malonyl-CoA O-methyltransferase